MMGNPTEVVITCKGHADDPDIQEKISALLKRLSQAAGADERMCNLKSVEPWNSVKVSFDLPREAAVRLQELARSGDNALIDLGILSVQIANGEPLDLNAIRELLQQPPPPQVPLPQQVVVDPPSTPSVPGVVSMPYQHVQQTHQQPQQQTSPGTSRPPPMQMPAVNQARKQTPKRPPSMPPQMPPLLRPPSSGALLPPHTPASGLVGLHTQMSSGGMKSPPYLTGPSPTSSIGNIPAGIPSLHLGQPAKSFNPNPPMNIPSPSPFSSVYSIAMSAIGNPNAPIQTPMMQSLPNLPTPQSAPIGSFPLNLGAKQPQFVVSGSGQPQVLPQWNQPMFPGGPNLPMNLPGSITSVGPLPSPSRVPPQRPVAPPAKPKKKKKRPRKPKEKIPPIPLPPPLMPPSSSEGIPRQKPLGMPAQPNLNPISPNGVPGMPNPNPAMASHLQHPRFPFTQTQVSQAGGSDVSMTSPLLVNLLQSDFASTQFPVQPGEPRRAASLGSSQRMPVPLSHASHHPGTTMPHAVSDGSHFPRNPQLQSFPHLLHRQQQQQLQQQQLQLQQQLQQSQQLPQLQQSPQLPQLQQSPRLPQLQRSQQLPQLQQPHGPRMPQLSLPNQTLGSNSGHRSIESFQHQQQQQPMFSTHMPYPLGAPGTPPTNFGRFPFPQGSLPPDHLQFMMQQVSSQAAMTEHRIPMMPQLRGNLPSGNLPPMTTVPSMVSPDAAGGGPTPNPTSVQTPPMQKDPSPPREPAKQRDPKSTSFDEESAMAGMTEAERDTFAAAARIAQDSKPGGMELDEFGEIALPSGELPTGKKGNFPVPQELSDGLAPPNKSARGMFAIENLAMSYQLPRQKAKKHSSPLNTQPATGLSRQPTLQQPYSRQTTAGGRGDRLSEMSFQQSHPKLLTPSLEDTSNDSIDLNSLQSSCAAAPMVQKMATPPLPFQSKAMSQSGQNDVLQNPFLAMPSIPSTVGPGQNPPPLHFTGTPSGSIPNLSISQGWTGGDLLSKMDAFPPDSVGKPRGTLADNRGTPTVPPKTLPSNPFEWPFSNISPPTQNLSSEGLQFMAKLAAVPGDPQFMAQHEMPHYSPLHEGSRMGKPDKPHLKALLNEISPSVEGQAGSPRAMKRSSSEEKSERKRRKSSPRPAPAPPDQMPIMYQPQRRVDHPGGSIELPRVPTAEELSFSVQQARAHSLDLMKGASSGYSPMPKSAPSSPRGKSRTKSVENTPQYGLQQSDLYRSKHGTLSPVNPMSGGFKVSTSSSKSGKSKESKSRSKSPKASGSKSSKGDASGFQSLSSVTTTANVPFAGFNEFRPPPGLNIRGPTNPLPYQNRKTPPQVAETQSPLSQQGISQFGSKQQRQSPLPPPTSDTQKKSPRASRPTSPFASASALLSSFAQSAGIKGPELPTTTPGSATDSPVQSPGYVTSPPLQKISTPTLPSNVNLGVPGESFPDDFHPGPTKGRAEVLRSYPTSVESEDKRHFQPAEQGPPVSIIPPYPGTTIARMSPQMSMGRILSAPGFLPGGHGINREGHFQTMPGKFPPMGQPGMPPLWRPPMSKQHLVGSEPTANAPNMVMPPMSKYEPADLPALRRNVGPSATQPTQNQDDEIPVSDIMNMPQFMSGEGLPGKGQHHGLSNLPVSSAMPVGLHPSEPFTGQRHFLNLRQSEANLLAYQASLDSEGTQKSAIGVSRHARTSVTELSGTPPSPYGGPNRPTFSLGMTSTVQHAITSSTIGQSGQPMTRVTRVMPIPQTGSIVPSYSVTTTTQIGPHRSSPGVGRLAPTSIPQSQKFSAPFPVSSLVSKPSETLQSQHSDEHRVPGIPTPQQMMSAGSFSTGLVKLEQTTSVGSDPSLPRPFSSAPPVTVGSASASTGSLGGHFQSSYTASEELLIPLQESGVGEDGDSPLGIREEMTTISSDVAAANQSSPSMDRRGLVHTPSSPAMGEGNRSPVGEVLATGIPMSRSSGLPPGESWPNSPQPSTPDGAGNFGQISGGSVIGRRPSLSTASSERIEGAGKTSSAPQPTVGSQPVQMNVEGSRQSQEQIAGIHNSVESVRTDITHPMVHEMSGSRETEADDPTDDEAEEGVPPQPGTMEFVDPRVAPEAVSGDGGDLARGVSPLGELQDDGDGEDGDSATSRKRSMRASGREKYYGPVPTYKRRKSNQK